MNESFIPFKERRKVGSASHLPINKDIGKSFNEFIFSEAKEYHNKVNQQKICDLSHQATFSTKGKGIHNQLLFDNNKKN